MADLPKLTKLVIAERNLNTGLLTLNRLLLLLHHAASHTVIRVNKCPNPRPHLSLPRPHTLTIECSRGPLLLMEVVSFIFLGNIYLAEVLNEIT